MRVLVVGSGPNGATYARRLLDRTDVSVVMVEAGPVLTAPAGMNVRNIPDEQDRLAARLASQGPSPVTRGWRAYRPARWSRARSPPGRAPT